MHRPSETYPAWQSLHRYCKAYLASLSPTSRHTTYDMELSGSTVALATIVTAGACALFLAARKAWKSRLAKKHSTAARRTEWDKELKKFLSSELVVQLMQIVGKNVDETLAVNGFHPCGAWHSIHSSASSGVLLRVEREFDASSPAIGFKASIVIKATSDGRVVGHFAASSPKKGSLCCVPWFDLTAEGLPLASQHPRGVLAIMGAAMAHYHRGTSTNQKIRACYQFRLALAAARRR
jgi:hypothetical protein